MRILKRCKDENGNTLWYKILGFNNNIAVLDKVGTIVLASRGLIDNATLTKNGTFRAKPDCNIETVIRSNHTKKVHNYFNTNKLYKFQEKKTLDSIEKDLTEKYKITNIANEEALKVIVETLAFDYANFMANYEGYIEEGMDARVLMELRKSAILPLDTWNDFFTGHNTFETAEDIRFYRTNMLKSMYYNYTDWDWDYYRYFKCLWIVPENYRIDFEDCYEDGDASRQTSVQDYIDGRLKNEYFKIGIIKSEVEFTPQLVAEHEPGLKFGFVLYAKPGEDCMDNGKAFLDGINRAIQEQE